MCAVCVVYYQYTIRAAVAVGSSARDTAHTRIDRALFVCAFAYEQFTRSPSSLLHSFNAIDSLFNFIFYD